MLGEIVKEVMKNNLAQFHTCRHCHKPVKANDYVWRLSSWWLICLDCTAGMTFMQVIENDGQLLLEDRSEDV